MGIFLGGPESRLVPTFPEPPIPPYPGAATGNGTHSVAPDQALTISTVWACVGLVANAVSTMPLETFRRTNTIPNRIPDPPIVAAPAAGLTQSEWLHMLMVSLLLRGNAYGRIVGRDSMMRPTQIELLNPDSVHVDVDRDTGALKYRLGQEPIPASDVFHVRGFTMPGTKVGLSPIAYAAATMGVDLAARQFGSDFLNGAGIPKAIIKSNQKVDEPQARTIKARVVAAVRGREPLVLGDGVDYTQIQVSPNESQFLETLQANVAQIARFFWVPPGFVGGTEGNSLTYSNREQRTLDFLTYGVGFWLKRIEDAYFPILPQPQFVRFHTLALLRTDAETQAKVDNMQLAGKTRVPSELRARDGLPPYTPAQQEEADMVPLTVTPTGGAKALPALKEPPGPAATVPADDLQGEPANA